MLYLRVLTLLIHFRNQVLIGGKTCPYAQCIHKFATAFEFSTILIFFVSEVYCNDSAIAGSTPPEGFGVSMQDFELLKVLGTGGKIEIKFKINHKISLSRLAQRENTHFVKNLPSQRTIV